MEHLESNLRSLESGALNQGMVHNISISFEKSRQFLKLKLILKGEALVTSSISNDL